MNGVVLADKPAGISSAAVVAIVKKKLSAEKIGHAGTLDPMATGLLVCLLGKATKLADSVQAGKKTYLARIKLGIITNSDDITGEVIGGFLQKIPSRDALRQKVTESVGVMEQVPPKVSACKVSGKRAYKLARAGEDFELKAKTVSLYSAKIENFIDDTEFELRISCTSGFYVRSLARDIGEFFGCGGTLSYLRREEIYPYNVSQAKAPENISQSDVLPWESALADVSKISVEAKLCALLKSGNQQGLSMLPQSNNHYLIYLNEKDIAEGILRKSETNGWDFFINF